MAQGIEFNIDARDQASKVLETVNKKIQDFGKDIGKGIIGFAGPMALVSSAIGFVTDKLAEMKQKAADAFNWGSGLSEAAAKMGVTVEEFQKITAAATATYESVDKVGKAFKLATDLITAARAGSKDAAAALEAMGLSTADLKNMKPEDVLKAIAAAMATTEDPTKRAQIAMAALGASAKDLQETLAKGFDIAGAFKGAEDLISQEEADLLRERALKDKQKELKEKVEEARKQARDEFLATKEGKEWMANELARQRSQPSALVPGAGYGSGAVVSVTDAQVDAELARIRKAKKEAEEAANRAKNPPSPKAAEALITRAEDLAKKEEEAKKKEPKEPKEAKEPKGSKIGGVSNEALGTATIKAPPLTVSSLREIGGAVAGESMAGNTIDLLSVQVDLQRSMLKELETLNTRSGDFTKPDPRLGLGSGTMLA